MGYLTKDCFLCIVVVLAVAKLFSQYHLNYRCLELRIMTTLFPELQSQIARAIKAIPIDHREQPVLGAVVADPTVAFIHL